MSEASPTPAAKRRWSRLLPRLLAVVAAVLIATTAYGIWTLYRTATVIVPNCYAVEWVASMVIDYMSTHDEEWPRGWDDLRESYDNVAAKASYPRPVDYPWTFDELHGRVDVDWNAKPRVLAAVRTDPSRPPFRVIWLRDGSQHHWAGAEPNQLILDYLRARELVEQGGQTAGMPP